MKKLLISIAATTTLSIGLLAILPNGENRNTTTQAQATFDHSQCQYPFRATNPPNGCDNTDPADPTNIKSATTKKPIRKVTKQTQVANICGGK